MGSITHQGFTTKRRRIGKSNLMAAGALLLVVGAGAWAEAGWSRDGSSSSSYSGSSYGSWSGSGDSSGTEKCTTSTIPLSLTRDDCLKCHPGTSGANSTNSKRHHNLINTMTPPASCINATGTVPSTLATGCHPAVKKPDGTFEMVVVADCLVCHTSSIHNTTTHCVVDTCRGCHPGSLPQIHSGGGSWSGSWSSYHGGSYGGSSSSSTSVSSCYLCHTSRDTRVQQAIIKGLAGQKISCDDCHGGGR